MESLLELRCSLLDLADQHMPSTSIASRLVQDTACACDIPGRARLLQHATVGYLTLLCLLSSQSVLMSQPNKKEGQVSEARLAWMGRRMKPPCLAASTAMLVSSSRFVVCPMTKNILMPVPCS